MIFVSFLLILIPLLAYVVARQSYLSSDCSCGWNAYANSHIHPAVQQKAYNLSSFLGGEKEKNSVV